MKNVHEVLREKELDLIRVRQQVEALRVVAPMLMEREEPFNLTTENQRPESHQKNRWPLDVDASRLRSLG